MSFESWVTLIPSSRHSNFTGTNFISSDFNTCKIALSICLTSPFVPIYIEPQYLTEKPAFSDLFSDLIISVFSFSSCISELNLFKIFFKPSIPELFIRWTIGAYNS